MKPLRIGRKRIALVTTALLVAGLAACFPQQADSENTETVQPAARSVERRAPEPARITVPMGTQLHVTLSTPVGSETSQVGDALTATTTAAVLVGDRIAIPNGSTIRGRVTDVVPGTKGLHVSEKGGAVALSFDKVTTPGGYSSSMSASLFSIAKSGGKTAGIIAGSAAGGALLGKILGGSTKDAAIGAVVGGGIGTGIAAGTKGKELIIPAGTHLALTLDQPLSIADRS